MSVLSIQRLFNGFAEEDDKCDGLAQCALTAAQRQM